MAFVLLSGMISIAAVDPVYLVPQPLIVKALSTTDLFLIHFLSHLNHSYWE